MFLRLHPLQPRPFLKGFALRGERSGKVAGSPRCNSSSHMKKFIGILVGSALTFAVSSQAQVNSGSDGSDGAFNPTQSVTINMADHPNGIYQYTTVNIPGNVTVTFTPNANNTPVVWLVQTDCVIAGTVSVFGSEINGGVGASGGPGGFRGGHAPLESSGTGETGQGPGGGVGGNVNTGLGGGNASFGDQGGQDVDYQPRAGNVYGNLFLLPLVGGSGGAGGSSYPSARNGGGGGGGAILIAASNLIQMNGSVSAKGGGATTSYNSNQWGGGGGSGGAIRLVSTRIVGGGGLYASAGLFRVFNGAQYSGSTAGRGRIRIDALENNFGGSIDGVWTQGFQPIIIPAPGQGVQLHIQSVAGNSVPSNPGGVLANPDVIVPAQQNNPIPIVVSCTNVPLNTEISVVVHPANGTDVQAVGINNSGTTASSTATVSLNMPRGGGIIYAKCVTGIVGGGTPSSSTSKSVKAASYAETGLTADGERFAKVETKATLGGKQETTFITESGKRFQLPAK